MLCKVIFVMCLLVPVVLNPIGGGNQEDDYDINDETKFLDLEKYLPTNSKVNSGSV
nr:IL-18 binding protein [Oriental turtle dovepox virus]